MNDLDVLQLRVALSLWLRIVMRARRIYFVISWYTRGTHGRDGNFQRNGPAALQCSQAFRHGWEAMTFNSVWGSIMYGKRT